MFEGNCRKGQSFCHESSKKSRSFLPELDSNAQHAEVLREKSLSSRSLHPKSEPLVRCMTTAISWSLALRCFPRIPGNSYSPPHLHCFLVQLQKRYSVCRTWRLSDLHQKMLTVPKKSMDQSSSYRTLHHLYHRISPSLWLVELPGCSRPRCPPCSDLAPLKLSKQLGHLDLWPVFLLLDLWLHLALPLQLKKEKTNVIMTILLGNKVDRGRSRRYFIPAVQNLSHKVINSIKVLLEDYYNS